MNTATHRRRRAPLFDAVRIEDDLLVTAGGREVRTGAAPSEAAQIAALMQD